MAPDDEDVNDYKLSEFDEKLEIEKLQETIKNMSNFTDDSDGFLSQSPQMLMQSASDKFAPDEDDEEFDPYAAIEQPVVTTRKNKPKKFVVMVEPENIPFFDSIELSNRVILFLWFHYYLLSHFELHRADIQSLLPDRILLIIFQDVHLY